MIIKPSYHMRKHARIIIVLYQSNFYNKPRWVESSNTFKVDCSSKQLLTKNNNWNHADVDTSKHSQMKLLNESPVVFRKLGNATNKLKNFRNITKTTSIRSERKQRKGNVVSRVFIFNIGEMRSKIAQVDELVANITAIA